MHSRWKGSTSQSIPEDESSDTRPFTCDDDDDDDDDDAQICRARPK